MNGAWHSFKKHVYVARNTHTYTADVQSPAELLNARYHLLNILLVYVPVPKDPWWFSIYSRSPQTRRNISLKCEGCHFFCCNAVSNPSLICRDSMWSSEIIHFKQAALKPWEFNSYKGISYENKHHIFSAWEKLQMKRDLSWSNRSKSRLNVGCLVKLKCIFTFLVVLAKANILTNLCQVIQTCNCHTSDIKTGVKIDLCWGLIIQNYIRCKKMTL